MLNRHYQPQLLKTEPIALDLADAEISYWREFLNQEVAWQWYERLRDNTIWRQEKITIYGKQHFVPRLSCWMADEGLDYRYSNMTMNPVAWSKDVLSIKAQLERKIGVQFNSVLLNFYRSGQDSNGWHADNEPELGENPVIASVSLGAARDFHLRHNQDSQLKHQIALQHGSLLIMQGATQSHWQHHIPKRANAEPRINLTFRTIQTNS